MEKKHAFLMFFILMVFETMHIHATGSNWFNDTDPYAYAKSAESRKVGDHLKPLPWSSGAYQEPCTGTCRRLSEGVAGKEDTQITRDKLQQQLAALKIIQKKNSSH